MSLPYEGDSANQNVPGISGKNSAGGIGVSGQSTGGVAGFFDGEVAVTRNITAQDILLAGAQPPGRGLVAQLQALTKRIQDLESQVLPVGCIVAFAGSFTGLPEWQLCDGKSVSKDAFPELFDAIGTNWGGDGNPNFNLPDLRGLFLRGVDGGSGIDEGIRTQSRVPIKPGGNAQQGVGSKESDSTKKPAFDFLTDELGSHEGHWLGGQGGVPFGDNTTSIHNANWVDTSKSDPADQGRNKRLPNGGFDQSLIRGAHRHKYRIRWRPGDSACQCRRKLHH